MEQNDQFDWIIRDIVPLIICRHILLNDKIRFLNENNWEYQ